MSEKEGDDSSVNQSDNVSKDGSLSLKGQKKLEKWRRIKEAKVVKRRQKKADSKQKRAVNSDDDNRLSKKVKRRLEKERLQAVLSNFNGNTFDGLHVCIDLQFEELMSVKELSHLAGQLRRVYGSNRVTNDPVLISIASLRPESKTMAVCQQKNDGFKDYLWHTTPNPVHSAFETKSLVYLTPDSENVLETLESNCVYVIGGLVDDSIKKNSSQTYASERDITTARLPIDKFAVKTEGSFVKRVLAINQVFDILLKFHQTQRWPESLRVGLPKRFGFEIQFAENQQ